jgi:hypothetical protein
VAGAGITHIPLLSILSDWNDPTMSLEHIGLEKLGDTPVHHVRITPPKEDGAPKELESPCDIFLDQQSFLPLRLIYLTRPPANLRVSAPVEVIYSDYRAVAGIAVPHQVRYTVRGQFLREYRVTSFAVNRGAQASDFELR